VEEGARLAGSQSNKDFAAKFVRVRIGPEIPKAAEHLFQVAKQRLLRDGDVEGAGGVFEEASRLAPRFARPYLYRSRLAEEEGDLFSGIELLEQAIKADPESWRAHRNLGMLRVRQAQWSVAEAPLRRALQLFAEDPGARLALARALYAQRKHSEFLQNARSALQIVSRDGGRHDLRAVTDFVQKLEQWGPGPAMPPAPDVPLRIGWNDD